MSEPFQDFDFDALDPVEECAPEAVLEFNRRAAVGVLLEILTHDADALEAGRRAFILAHELRFGVHRRKQDLARHLGITPGRLSQLLKRLNATITALNKGLGEPAGGRR